VLEKAPSFQAGLFSHFQIQALVVFETAGGRGKEDGSLP
jgi:hypothetical protein